MSFSNAAYQPAASGPARAASSTAAFGNGGAIAAARTADSSSIPRKAAAAAPPAGAGALGLRTYASSPSWGASKAPEQGVRGRRPMTARGVFDTEHASSIKIA